MKTKDKIIYGVLIALIVGGIIGYLIGDLSMNIKIAGCLNKCPDNWIGYSFDCLRSCMRG